MRPTIAFAAILTACCGLSVAGAGRPPSRTSRSSPPAARLPALRPARRGPATRPARSTSIS